MFEDLGFFKEYFVNGKFIGTCKCEKDREIVGYIGRMTESTDENILLDNKKIIKKNTEVVTYLYPLTGKLIKE